MHVGNDIVDLREKENLSPSLRFRLRVFTDAELDQIHRSPERLRTLWMIWSAKEAGFKIAKKIDPNTIFAHREFIVSVEQNLLQHQTRQFSLLWNETPYSIHCVATELLPENQAIQIVQDQTNCETPTPSRLSNQVRSSALQLLARYRDVENVRITRPLENGKIAHPRFEKNSAPIGDLDLSLSHDGSLTAAVILFRKPQDETPTRNS